MNLEELSGPKRRIFEMAVELFATRTYETVTMADIAEALNRKKPSIYNHFASKQDILDMMYDFFVEHLFDQRKTLEELKPVLETGSILEMMYSLSFQFRQEYMKVMTGILTVIHQRKYFDERTKEIAREMMIDEGMRYVEEAFNYAIEIGRLAPFNTHWLALVLNDTRNGEYMRATLDPSHDRMAYIRNEEILVYQHAAAMITDLRPPYAQRDVPTFQEGIAFDENHD
ncbi:TetR/AcrR family transcriptional regulator [Eubacteriales bacterium OttesenSCG-928-A19]|nr:TetR/AcrR family transcriptional regulator [Eubacteriales bacterium OttesenSCG-928-A19]